MSGTQSTLQFASSLTTVAGGLFNSIDNLINGPGIADQGPASIEKFKSVIRSHGDLLPENRYLFIFQLPPYMRQNNLTVDSSFNNSFNTQNAVDPNTSKVFINELPFYCESCLLPSVALKIQQYYKQGYGLSSQMPYDISYRDLPTRFYCDSEGLVMNFFHSWIKSIVNLNYDTHNTTADGALPMEFSYKKEYATTAHILVFNKNNQTILVYEFEDIFPYIMGDVNLNWGGRNWLSVPIVFTFKAWRTLSLTSQSTQNTTQSIGSTIVKAAQLIRGVANITQPVRNVSDVVNIFNTGSGIKSLLGL
jgi:hypothetical protein